MTREEFKAKLIIEFYEQNSYFPDESDLAIIKKLNDFAFNGA